LSALVDTYLIVFTLLFVCFIPPLHTHTHEQVSHGVGIEELDKMVKGHGMPVGPITLADEVGIDVANHVREFLCNADMGVRMAGSGGMNGLNPMHEMVDQGFLGKKTGKGFFTYDTVKGKQKKTGVNPAVQARLKELVTEDLKLSKQEVLDRLLSRFVNEAVLCLQDEIIANPSDGDLGAVFGCGFLPYTGGPFRMLDAYGADK